MCRFYSKGSITNGLDETPFLDKPQFTRANPRLQVKVILNEQDDQLCFVCGRVRVSPRDQDGLPTLAFALCDGEVEEVAAERAALLMMSEFFGVELVPRLMVKLGVVSGATGVYVRTHVFWYAHWLPRVPAGPPLTLLPEMWDAGSQLTWETGRAPPGMCDTDREELVLFHAFARELMGVQLFWPERGFGTSMVQDPHGHGRGRGRKRAFVVFCADE